MIRQTRHKRYSRSTGLNILKGVSLKKHCSFRIGGRADLFISPSGTDELIKALSFALKKRIRTLILGNGSNILFSDSGFRGMVIKLSKGFGDVRINGRRVTAGAGASMAALINKASSGGLAGLEFACGIPSSVGGAVAMNLGSWGREIRSVVRRVWAVKIPGTGRGGNLKVVELKRKRIKFGYRTTSLLRRNYILTAVEFALKKGRKSRIRKRVRDNLSRKRQSQPLGVPSAGCVFKNPAGRSAGALIEESGLSGKRVGDAQISTKHANFIINSGFARAKDVLCLIGRARRKVKSLHGISLKREIVIV